MSAPVGAGREQRASAAHRPPHRWTSAVLGFGTLAAGGCLLVGMVLAVLAPQPSAQPAQPALLQVVESVLALRPWGWAMLGALVLLATPAAGLVATAVELRAAQPLAALSALAVLVVLAVAVAIALA